MFANLTASRSNKTTSFLFRILPAKKRFSLGKVFRTVIIAYLSLIILAFCLVFMFPSKVNRTDLNLFFSTYYIVSLITNTVFFTFFYYYAINYYYYLITEKKGFFYYFASSILLSVIFYIYLLAKDYFRPGTTEGGEWSSGIVIAFYVMCLFLSVIPSLLIAFIANIGDGKKQRKVLEAQKLQLEIEKSNANLNFLKAQINPHFLHNTLNFLYAKSLPYSPELSEGILTLSDIMRYALSEANLKDGKAALKDEIEHLRNIIRIHQLRYNNNLHVNFEVYGITNGVTIIPFVLITIVENAFKHGDLKSTEYPIDIRLTIEHNSLQFYCRNKKKTGPKELSTGIGLDNIQKRLDLAYKDQYSLHIKDEHELYTTQLTILSL